MEMSQAVTEVDTGGNESAKVQDSHQLLSLESAAAYEDEGGGTRTHDLGIKSASAW